MLTEGQMENWIPISHHAKSWCDSNKRAKIALYYSVVFHCVLFKILTTVST